jgi:hypothetical protein
MLAERRGAFLNAGTDSNKSFWIKNVMAIFMNIALPAVLFGMTLKNAGPRYPSEIDFWQIIGSIYLAGAPIGSHHLWIAVARIYGWLPSKALDAEELDTYRVSPFGSFFWVLILLYIPLLIAIVGYPVPYGK